MAALIAAGCSKEEPTECGEFDEVFVWADDDGDGFGNETPIGYVCAPGPNQANNDADCDDAEAAVYPGAEEICDLLDNDCNSRIDETHPKTAWYEDADGDTFGSTRGMESACAPPTPQWIPVSGDCDDDNPEVNPGAREICNAGLDDDCDTFADDEDGGVDPTTYTRFHEDLDNDGFGGEDNWIEQCIQPNDTLLDGSDCDDGRPQINPDGDEVCNTIDDDCDDLIDDFDPDVDPTGQTAFYADVDGDGYGDAGSVTQACFATPGIGVDNDDDCDDNDPTAFVDQWWYHDLDGDGFGAGAQVVFQCLDPGGDLAPGDLGLDCNDGDPLEHPAVFEVCDDLADQNCDALIDCDDSDCIGAPGCLQACADLELVSTVPSVTNGNTTGKGDDSDPSCVMGSNAPDMAFQWVPTVSGMVTIDLQGTNWDTTLYVRDGCGGMIVACNDDVQAGTYWSRVQFQATAGTAYIVVVDAYSTDNGPFTLNVN